MTFYEFCHFRDFCVFAVFMLLEILEVSIVSDFCNLFTSLWIFVTLYDFHELDDFIIFVNFV